MWRAAVTLIVMGSMADFAAASGGSGKNGIVHYFQTENFMIATAGAVLGVALAVTPQAASFSPALATRAA